CCNTAWLSMRSEQQGSLWFPAEHLPKGAEESVTVAVFHHPYNWLSADNSREFRSAIENIADLVMTGHEHDPVQRVTEVLGGARNLYLEGGALQIAPECPDSAFNVLVLDTRARESKLATFAWQETRYVPKGDAGGDGAGLAWVAYAGNAQRNK